MTLALLDTRAQGVGAQLNLRDDGTLELIVACRYGVNLLAQGALLSPAQTRELWHQLGAALLHPDRAHWRPCPTWDNGCHCSPVFACQRDPVTPRGAVSEAAAPGVPPKADNQHIQDNETPVAAAASPGGVHAATSTAVHAATSTQQPVTLGGRVYQPLPDDQNPFAPGDDGPFTQDELREMGVTQ